MKRVLICFAALFLFSGCTVISNELAEAIKVQTHYTREYVKMTRLFTADEEIIGIGERLVKNCDELDKLVEE